MTSSHESRPSFRQSDHKLRQILKLTRDQWDRPEERDAVRQNFGKVCACRTPALGGQVYASECQEKVSWNTCKSKCCSSCGNRSTLLWQREQWCSLPDIPFVGIGLTMPDVFWPIFLTHRNLQHDLPALGAAVIQQWAWTRFHVRLYVIVVQHTSGGRLNYHPHLHIMVSSGGLKPAEACWVQSLAFDGQQVMELWRDAVCAYLRKANYEGLLEPNVGRLEFIRLVDWQQERSWNVHISREISKRHFLRYAGRYIRRLPISEKRILRVTQSEVVYQEKHTRTKTVKEVSCTPAEFVARLSPHVLDRYCHSMRYFGLVSPRMKRLTSAAVFALLGQQSLRRPPRQYWAASIYKHFGVDPLLDVSGKRMHWVRHLKPVPSP